MVFLLWNCEATNQKKNPFFEYAPNNTFQILYIPDYSELNDAINENQNLDIILGTKPEIKSSILSYIPKTIKGPIVVFFSQELKDDFTVSVAFDGEQNRNFKFQVIEEIKYEDRNIEIINYHGNSFLTQLDQTMYYTKSLMTIESVIRNHVAGYSGINSESFDLQITSVESNPLVQLIYRSDKSSKNDFLLPPIPFFPEIELEWTQMNLFHENNKIDFQINRFFDHLSINRLHLFKDLPKVKLKTNEICPIEAELYFAIGIPDYRKLEANYNTYLRRFNLELLDVNFSSWKDLKEIGFFSLNGNSALALRFPNNKVFDSDLISLESQIGFLGEYPLHQVSLPDYMMQFFRDLGFEDDLNYMTIINQYFIYSDSSIFLEKIIQYYESEQTLSKQLDHYSLNRMIDKTQSFVWIANTDDLIHQWLETEAKAVKEIFQLLPTADIPYTKISADVSENQIITHTTFPPIDLTSTYSKHLKSTINHNRFISSRPQWTSPIEGNQYRIVFQDSMNVFHILDMNGNPKLDIFLNASLTSPVYESVHVNNSKHLVFRTNQDIYFVDLELGDLNKRNITSFIPTSSYLIEHEYADQKTKNFYTIDDNTIQRFDQSNNKFTVQGYQLKGSLLEKPSILKIHDQHYIVFHYTTGNVEIVDYDTWEVIPFSEIIAASSTRLFSHQNQFGFIDLSGHLTFYDIEGNIKQHPIQFEPNSCIQSENDYLVYISGNALFINNKIIQMPYGDYLCPMILNTPFGYITGLMDQENQRYYLFNDQGNRISGFPVKTSVPLDIIYDGTNETIKLLGLNDQKTIGFYELTASDIH